MSAGRVQQVRETKPSEGNGLQLALEQVIDPVTQHVIELVTEQVAIPITNCVTNSVTDPRVGACAADARHGILSPNMSFHRQVALARVLRDYLH